MPALFVFAIIFFVMAALTLPIIKASPQKTKEEHIPAKKIWRWVGGILLGLALIMLFFASFKTVSTKNVGIETAFGRTAGELSNGIHFILPWDKITEMDAAIQINSYTEKECLNVRIANQQTACVDISIRWRIHPQRADVLFQDYHSFENVRESLVTRELTAAVNSQLANYNPLNSVVVGTPSSGGSSNLPLSSIAANVTKQMQDEIGNEIEVINTIIPIITFDKQTQSRINQLQQQIAETRIAEQSELTAQARSKANKALASSVNNSPNVLVAHCYEILSTMVKEGMQVPAGFSCWPGSGLAGVIASSPSSGK